MRKWFWVIAAVMIAGIWAEPLISVYTGRHKAATRVPEAVVVVRPSLPVLAINPSERLRPTPSAALELPLLWTARYADVLASLKLFETLPTLPTTVLSTTAGRSLAENRPVPPAGSSVSPGATAAIVSQVPAKSGWARLRGTNGYWRLGQTADGVWWFVSPENTPEFMNMVTTVQPFQLPREPLGAHFVSNDFAGDEANAAQMNSWARQTMRRVLDAGFKGLGAWSNRSFHQVPIAITRDLNVWAAVPQQAFRLYHPQWRPAADAWIKRQVEPLRNNRYLVGYFTDNELDFSDVTVGPGAYFNRLPPDDPNRAEVMKVIREIWPDLAAFNLAWHVGLKDWTEAGQWKEIPREPEQAYSALRSRWLEHIMGDYFRMTGEMVRSHDPNHLLLGIRYAGFAPSEVVRAARPYTDAQSINYYVSDAMLDPTIFQSLHDESDQPIVISEYSFHALDGRSGNRNTAGFAAQVVDQAARAEAYRLMTTRLARVPYIIGADWFQWSDEPPSGRSSDGEDVNFGVVDIDDHPYSGMVAAIRQTAAKVNALHAGSSQDEQRDVWRSSLIRPVARIAYLPQAIRLDGRLDDWPEANRFPALRLSQTVGLDVAEAKAPTVMLGWRPEGMYLAFDVPDTDPITAPMTGHWWTRDCVEFWFATRPVHELENGYNEYCHQFFFMPLDPANNGGTAGAVGQWHRSGDALKDNLAPHPDIRYCCRIMGDHYVVELFIPKGSLNGFDPAQHSQLAFNIATRNYRKATSWYWSTSKELHTQSRPTTWGDIRLLPPGMAAVAAGVPVR